MKTYVYKITRIDGKQYIGITPYLHKRMRAHEKSKRFDIGISHIEILAVCNSYDEAGTLEEKYILQYDTFHNGLNSSINGKGNHLSKKFTTLGYKYSEESKQKMKDNHWAKKGFVSGMLGKKHSEDTKKKWSSERKNKCWGPRKISLEDSKKILESFTNNEINFTNEFYAKFVKKTQREAVINNQITFEEMISQNGKPLKLETLYAYWFSEMYGVTPQAIRRIISGQIKFCEDGKSGY
jgi:hypothetical protein